MDRTKSWMLVGRKGGSSATRLQRTFPTREAADKAMVRWTKAGRATLWLYGPAKTEDGERPLLIEPDGKELTDMSKKKVIDSEKNQHEQFIGNELRKAYVSLAKLPPIEAKQDYTITDAICSLMHHARKRGMDPHDLVRSAVDHFTVETTICTKCGMAEDPDNHDCETH